ncbi:twin-arginine translocase TatA/TatE family subunit [Chengkuizengella sediminis]|uniref:twin-arginine translocase TatA/TatE family subunit n=1 Tax=Chengkuizengella sediminis TaxID=1885917 RepID=UPI00138958CD|nr:twin-arginine translocase TatA/TatE family subunit [Chengkuizengella sediminis]NDI36252.1 twin-arginine translocase TatA/TatE family subunit [Chengkuizengella sediminis]
MGIASIGIPGLLIILVLALILFGPSKLPQLGKAIGTTIKEFRNGANELMDSENEKTK